MPVRPGLSAACQKASALLEITTARCPTQTQRPFVSTLRHPERKRLPRRSPATAGRRREGPHPGSWSTQSRLRNHRPLARSLTPKAFGFGRTPAARHVERRPLITPRKQKKIAESIDTDSVDSIILLPRPEKFPHAFD